MLCRSRIVLCLLALALAGFGATAFVGCGDDVGEVDAPLLALDPERELIFDAVGVGDSNTRILTVTNAGTGTLQILDTQIEGPNGVFSAELAGPSELLPEETSQFLVTYTPQTEDRVTGELIIASNGGNRAVDLIPQETAGRIYVAPDPIAFGRVLTGQEATQEVAIQNIGSATLQVDDIRIVPTGRFRLVDDFTFPMVLAPQDFNQFTVSYTPENDQFDQAVLIVSSTDESTPRVEVQITANGAEPCISVTHEEGYDFNERVIGQTHTEALTIQNCSDPQNGQDLEIYSIEWLETDAALEFGTLPGGLPAENLVLAPGASAPLELRFTPTEERVSQAVLRITSNDEVKNPLDIDIRGVGSNNQCPTAVARCRVVGSTAWDTELSVLPLQTIECDSSQSVDPDGGIASYQWTVVNRPPGSVAPLTPNANHESPSLFIDIAGEYRLRLNVIDDRGAIACEPADVRVVAVPDETIHVQLTWHTPNDPNEADTGNGAGSDLDLHFIHPNGSIGDRTYDCYFRNRVASWGDPTSDADDPSLDIDDTDGAGPENINLDGPEDGLLYRVGVHYFNDHGFGPSDATLRIYIFGLLQFELTRTLSYSRLGAGDYWDVAAISWPDADVVRIDQVESVCDASNGTFPTLGCP